jgi:tetratricopeptide (TPR) repeat protein
MEKAMFNEDAEIRRDIKKLKSRIKKSPLLFARLADCYARIGEIDLAEKTLKSGIEKYPNYTTGLLVLGELYLYRSFYRDAEEVVQKGLQLEPNHLGLLRLLKRIKKGMECDQECARIQAAIAHLDPLGEAQAETAAETDIDRETTDESPTAAQDSDTLPTPAQMWKFRAARKPQQIETQETELVEQAEQDQEEIRKKDSAPAMPPQSEAVPPEHKTEPEEVVEVPEFAEYLKDISIYRPEDEKSAATGEEPEAPPIKPRIATKTLGELYAKQNQFAEAIAIYEKLLENDPENESFRTRLEELRTRWELSMEESSREPADG